MPPKLFNGRQKLSLWTIANETNGLHKRLPTVDSEYATAITTCLALAFDRLAESNTMHGRWISAGEKPAGAYGRQAFAMGWDYCEINPMEESPRQFGDSIEWVHKYLSHFARANDTPAIVSRSSATRLPFHDSQLHTLVTDPPYYDSVPYSDLSDFFYVWLKRMLGAVHVDVLRTPLTSKQEELIAYWGNGKRQIQKPPEWYEEGMQEAFGEMKRVLSHEGVCCVMFAHKSTNAWEAVISGLLSSGLTITGSWPLHTERQGRLLSIGSAALASSVTFVCRRRRLEAGTGLWDDVRQD